MIRTWLILGAGYTGGRLAARRAAAGDLVVSTHRHLDGDADGPALLPNAPSRLALDLDGPLPPLPEPAGVVVYCAPPGAPPGQREARLIAALRGCVQLIYLSSTGVYAPGGGHWVDERWPVEPEGEHGKARLVAEGRVVRAAEAAGLPWTILRAAGIYGPDRGLVARVRRGDARVIGDGAAHVSRIHVEDLVAAIEASAARQVTGIINCGDDDPTPHGVVLDGVAAQLGLPPPPRVDAASVSAAARAMLLADRKVANHRLRRELGVELAYPSWRDAVRAELADGGG